MKTSKENKKGISLIVLVITIIVMIILATAVVIALSNSGIMEKANTAVEETNLDQVQNLATMLWSDAYIDGVRTKEELETAVMEGLKAAIGEAKLNNYIVIVTKAGVTVKKKEDAAPAITLDNELSEDNSNPTYVESASYTLSGTVMDENGIKSLTINGTEIVVAEDGTWSTTLTLTKDEITEVTIVATDTKGNTTTKIGYISYIEYTAFTVTASNRSKIGYTDETTDLVIPETFYDEEDGKWYKVTAISTSSSSMEAAAFYNCTNLKSVVIPGSVTSIGKYAFYNCTSLTSVVIPDGVTSIGVYVFRGCTNLSSVTIPVGVTFIGRGVFYDCTSLTSVVIPAGVTSIGDDAFYNCTSLTSVVIPAGVTSIGSYAFCRCSSLTDITIPDSVTAIEDATFLYCTNLQDVSIGNGVTTIGADTFRYCTNLTNITIGNSVTYIGARTFNECTNLTNVYITDISAWCGIKFVDSYSNPLCKASNLYLNGKLVEDLIIPEGVIAITNYAFRGCKSLISVVIPDSVTSIGDYAFYVCANLQSIYIGSGVTSISSLNLYGCNSLTGIWFDENNPNYFSDSYGVVYTKDMTELVEVPVAGLTGDYNILEGITSIPIAAFSGCTKLTGISIPEGVTSIENSAFSNCTSLTNAIIPEGITSIGYAAFSSCTKLTGISIPSSVTSIGSRAVHMCSKLASATFANTAGWYVTKTSGDTSGTDVDVSDASTAATMLKSTYYSYYWYRSE